MNKKIIEIKRNSPDWVPSDLDYELVFCECLNEILQIYEWRECGHNIPRYSNMLLADYLQDVGVTIPDYCQFCRIINENFHFEYRAYSGRVRIDVIYDNIY